MKWSCGRKNKYVTEPCSWNQTYFTSNTDLPRGRCQFLMFKNRFNCPDNFVTKCYDVSSWHRLSQT